MYILGISAYYHDSAACLLKDGEIVAAAQEERFTRKKHDMSFPKNAIRYCMSECGIAAADINTMVFYEKPFLKFERLLHTYLAYAPKGFRSFLASMPMWLKDKLFLKASMQEEFARNFGSSPSGILFSQHHKSHAASAFYPSPFNRAAVLCLDGVGEWATTSAWLGIDNSLKLLWEIRFPHSLGMFYSAFTYYTGFKVNSGEYKVMGLAPYGKPRFKQLILDNLIELKNDGSFRLNMDYFDFCTNLKMTSQKFHDLFGGPPRVPESPLTEKETDLARSLQEITEEIILRMAKTIRIETGEENLCLAGGTALNCVANGRILRESGFHGIWIQPAAGDAGGAVGCALNAWHGQMNRPRKPQYPDSMKGALLGPCFSDDEILAFLESRSIPHSRFDHDELIERTARDLASGKIVGWFQGRMEFGPRALGNRSILGDPRSQKMQSHMNLKIKFRESFRPFAPSILRERLPEYFEMNVDSPYMLMVAPVVNKRRIQMSEEQKKLWGIQLLNIPKSDIPAVTHIDYSARVQSVHSEINPGYYKLIKAFDDLTGCPVLVNTSFNIRGEPIVCTPQDAYRCFMCTDMDTLVMGNIMLEKSARLPDCEGRIPLEKNDLD